ncbi:hypothetical protein EJ05DRAFT_480763 [Pseudovirgaria hyperparasitica]|uniref:TNT domain-containing protein n=1 Tax=Pseudovirgaria hyperparasitica TaxID=470096 RepID=A0A6A6VR30_9PEZI|nr:uncharacterized protein EJ05DRAFT_480763 [Pseudovirgaria hyperparasitica]KAF2753052.1 hypothetical protein EJ05DRAFT_480763 [Pseudovirgaria hyperparasitica]
MRSLSPDILWAKYTVYKVVKEFEAKVGPIEPGFEQPGYGTQIVAIGWGRADKMCDDKVLVRVEGVELERLMGSLE